MNIVSLSKSVTIMAFVSFVVYCCFFEQQEKIGKTPCHASFHKYNHVANFSYDMATEGRSVRIEARGAVLSGDNVVEISDVSLSLKFSDKKVDVSAERCTIDLKNNKVYLDGKIVLKTENDVLYAEKATINMKTEEIISDSKVFGKKNGMKFEADSFYIKKDSKISFKKIKMIHEND